MRKASDLLIGSQKCPSRDPGLSADGMPGRAFDSGMVGHSQGRPCTVRISRTMAR